MAAEASMETVYQVQGLQAQSLHSDSIWRLGEGLVLGSMATLVRAACNVAQGATPPCLDSEGVISDGDTP